MASFKGNVLIGERELRIYSCKAEKNEKLRRRASFFPFFGPLHEKVRLVSFLLLGLRCCIASFV